MSSKFTIGLIQLAFSKDTSENLKKAVKWIEKQLNLVHRLFVFRSFSDPNTFARQRI